MNNITTSRANMMQTIETNDSHVARNRDDTRCNNNAHVVATITHAIDACNNAYHARDHATYDRMQQLLRDVFDSSRAS